VLADGRTPKVRRAALTAIAMIPDEADRPLYTKFLKDRDDGLRAAAAEGLARLKNPADAPALQKDFGEERKMPPRLALAFAVVTLGKREVSEFSPLQYLINQLNSVAWRGVARAYLIEVARDPGVRESLQRATVAATKQEKIELAQILSQSGDKDTVRTLEALSRDSDSDVAGTALNAMRSLKARLP